MNKVKYKTKVGKDNTIFAFMYIGNNCRKPQFGSKLFDV